MDPKSVFNVEVNPRNDFDMLFSVQECVELCYTFYIANVNIFYNPHLAALTNNVFISASVNRVITEIAVA